MTTSATNDRHALPLVSVPVQDLSPAPDRQEREELIKILKELLIVVRRVL